MINGRLDQHRYLPGTRVEKLKSDVDPCSHGRDTDHQKSADGQTDRQTAFQLYIVDT